MSHPNLLILTTGCANSTITMRMLEALGWNLGEVDRFAENRIIRELNYGLIRKGLTIPKAEAEAALASLTQPWAIKHPEMSHALPAWLNLLAPYKPAMLYLTKDQDYVRKSFSRRFQMAPELADKRRRLCDQHFDQWLWPKLKLDADQVVSAIRLFDIERTFKHRVDTPAAAGVE